jgi:hypothetical protein
MIRSRPCLALVVLLVSGCAGAPELQPAELAAAAPSAAAPNAAPAEAAPIIPDLVVDANELIARQPTPPICRQILRKGSNVIVTQCMSAADWKLFERREAREAAGVVRMLQGGRYR